MTVFGRRMMVEQPADDGPATPVGAAADRPALALAAVARAATQPTQIVVESPAEVVEAVIDSLKDFIRDGGAPGGQPAMTVSVLQVTDRTLGIGNARGLQTVGAFSATELYGGRIDCVVRFKMTGADADAADSGMTALQGRLFGGRADLWNAGFLEFDGVAGTLPSPDGAEWSRTADYHALIEYYLTPAPPADSLIAAIPIAANQEVDNTIVGETSTVTDHMVRWDDISAPALTVRGPGAVDRLAVAAFLPTPAPTGDVELSRSFDGATGAPEDFATLAAFIAAVGDPTTPHRHARFVFASVSQLVADLDLDDEIELGDWDEDGDADEYAVGHLTFDPPIPLPAAIDRLQIVPVTTPLDHIGVVYLRVSGTLG